MGEASLECLGFFACHFYPTSGKTEARGDPWVGTGPRRAEKRGSQPSLAPAGPGWEEAGSSAEKRRPRSRRAVLSQPELSGHVWGAVGREGRELGRPPCSASIMSRASLSDVPATRRVGWGSLAPDPTPGIVCCRSCP